MKHRVSLVLGLLACLSLSACQLLPTPAAKRSAAPPAASTSQEAPVAPTSELPATPEYTLGPGDIVRITVYNSPDLTTEAEVSQGGTIGFPLIGEVKVGGLTRAQAEREISARLRKGGFVSKAHVNMMVTQYRSQQISVIGEVHKPGKYPINQVATLTDAIAMAGGITPKGSYMVTVIRKEEGGRTAQYAINFKSLLDGADGGMQSRNIRISPEDVVYVAPAPVFYIYGEVRSPGAYPLQPDMTVRQALSLGGGLTPRGTERGIQIDRKGPRGEVITQRARLTDRVRPDDVLQVPEGWF
jgi:polysaccharide export outer membrane protein